MRRLFKRAAGAAGVVIIGGLAWAVPALAHNGGTDPDYPGSTLHVSVSGNEVEDGVIYITGTGSNADLGDYVSYGLDIFEIAPEVLKGPCEQSESKELSDITNVPNGGRLLTYQDLNEGEGGSFNIREPVQIGHGYGPLRICAYSVYVTDDAAWDQADITVKRAGSSSSTAAVKPKLVKRPTISRSGTKLICHGGSWTPSGVSLSYVWRLKGTAHVLGRSASLVAGKSTRGRQVTCTVTAKTSAGSTSATTAPWQVSS